MTFRLRARKAPQGKKGKRSHFSREKPFGREGDRRKSRAPSAWTERGCDLHRQSSGNAGEIVVQVRIRVRHAEMVLGTRRVEEHAELMKKAHL